MDKLIKNHPKISIITPSFNQAEYLEQTIQSVLDQAYQNLEYIIIDGGSTDHSVEIIKKYEHKLTYWISEKDSGQSQAINKGFAKCTGEIIGWLNSDDVLVDNALKNVAKCFVANKIQILVGGSQHWEPKSKVFIPHTTNPETYFDLLKYNKTICLAQPSVFYTRNLLLSCGGYLNEKLHYTMDLDLWFRFGIFEGINKKIFFLNEPISLMRIQSNQKTTSMNYKAMKEAAKVVLYYSKKYNIRFIDRLTLFFRYRSFRYSLVSELWDRLKFLDIIGYRAVSKLFSFTK